MKPGSRSQFSWFGNRVNSVPTYWPTGKFLIYCLIAFSLLYLRLGCMLPLFLPRVLFDLEHGNSAAGTWEEQKQRIWFRSSVGFLVRSSFVFNFNFTSTLLGVCIHLHVQFLGAAGNKVNLGGPGWQKKEWLKLLSKKADWAIISKMQECKYCHK